VEKAALKNSISIIDAGLLKLVDVTLKNPLYIKWILTLMGIYWGVAMLFLAAPTFLFEWE